MSFGVAGRAAAPSRALPTAGLELCDKRGVALSRSCVRLIGISAGVVLVIALGAGLIRLLPWLLAPDVPLEISAPFAAALAAVATEAAVLVALPVGCALGAAGFVERGEARGLLALGASPLRLAGGALPGLTLIAALGCVAIVAWGDDSAAPGRFAQHLIDQGRSSCGRAREPKSALVPMVGMTWLCFPGREPRLVAPLPRSAGRAWFSAAALQASDDLRTFALRDLRIGIKLASETLPRVMLRAKTARVAGMSAWGRSARLPLLLRALCIASAALATGFAASAAVMRWSIVSRVGALVTGGVGAAAATALLGAADRHELPSWSYVAVPAVAAASVLGTAAIWALGRSQLARRRALLGRIAWR